VEKPNLPVFQGVEFSTKWVEENPPMVIPAEVEPEYDRDWTMTEEEEDALIATYFASKLEQ
jgi:hypothetical protein